MRAVDLSCEACSITWEPPARDGGGVVERYVVSGAAQVVHEPAPGWDLRVEVLASSTSFVAKALRPGTSYRFTVAAVNAAGSGLWSAPAVATTRPAQAPPEAPEGAPWEAAATAAAACDGISLRLPTLRGGCAADEGLVVEMAASGATPGSRAWHAVGDAVTEAHALVDGLGSPPSSYVFRLRARNALGLSAPGPASGPLVPGGSTHLLLAPPIVEAASSFAYRVEWGGERRGDGDALARCHPSLRWRLEYRRSHEGAQSWTVLVDRTAARSLQAKLRCPEGCAFRVWAIGVGGWDAPSRASELLATRTLHPPAHGAARLRLALRAPLPASASLRDAQHAYEAQLATALGVPAERVHGVEFDEVSEDVEGDLRAFSFVFDLLPSTHAHLSVDATAAGGAGWAPPADEVASLARHLAAVLRDGSALPAPLRAAIAIEDVEGDIDLVQLAEDGRERVVGPAAAPPPPPTMRSKLHAHAKAAGSALVGAMSSSVVAALVLAAVALALLGRRRRSRLQTTALRIFSPGGGRGGGSGAYVALALPPLEFAADAAGERLGDDGALLVDDSRAASPNDDDWPADEASNGQPRERLTDAAFDQEGGARLAADDDFPAVELQPRQKQQVALDWASEREAAVVKSLAL